jgi:hypothetical protein
MHADLNEIDHNFLAKEQDVKGVHYYLACLYLVSPLQPS